MSKSKIIQVHSESPLLREVQHGILKAINGFTGLYFPQIYTTEEWKAFYSRKVLDEKSCKCIFKGKKPPFPIFHFEWDARMWTLRVSNPEELITLDQSKVFDPLVIPGSQVDDGMPSVLFDFSEYRAKHIPVSEVGRLVVV